MAMLAELRKLNVGDRARFNIGEHRRLRGIFAGLREGEVRFVVPGALPGEIALWRADIGHVEVDNGVVHMPGWTQGTKYDVKGGDNASAGKYKRMLEGERGLGYV